MKAKDSGKDASAITDNDLRKDICNAVPGEVAGTMTACMTEAANDVTKEKACKDSATAAMKLIDLDGKTPDDTKFSAHG